MDRTQLPPPASLAITDFRLLFEALSGLYLVLNRDFKIMAANDAYLRATMTRQSEILGRTIFDVFPDNPADPEATGVRNLRASLERVLRNRVTDVMAVQKYDIRRPASEGGTFEVRYWSPMNSPVYGSDGELLYIIHRVEDVTEFIRLKHQESEQHKITEALRTRTEQMEGEIYLRGQELQRINQQLRASEELVHTILDSAPDAFVAVDANSIITDWNQQAEKTFGWLRNQVIGRSLAETIIPPRYREAHHHGLKHFLATGEAPLLNQRIELVALHKDGHEFPVELAIAKIQLGPTCLFYSFLHDISDRKKVEDTVRASDLRFRLLLEAVVDYAIIMLDPQGNIATWNIGAERIMCYKAEEIIGKHFSCFYPREVVEKGWPERELKTAAAKGRFEDEGWRLRKDGSRFWANVMITALRDEKGNLNGFSKITRDLTERKNVEDALRQAHDDLERRVQQRTAALDEANRALQEEITDRKRLEDELRKRADELVESNAKLSSSNQELHDFAYVASHDLKEPLRGIFNYSTFLIEDYADKLDKDGLAKLQTLQHLSRRLDGLIDSLLEFSRVGRLEFAIRPTDLNEVVSGILESLRIPLEERKIEIRVPRPLPTIRCDHIRTGEVFLNLITNAMKYNDKAEKWIEIGFCEPPVTDELNLPEHQPGDVVPAVFYVRDNGIGIPQKYFEAVFKIFKRLHGRDRFGGGSGAGLTIVKRIIERHNGSIWIESKQNEGSTFYFTLPSGKESSDEQIHSTSARR